MNLTYYTEVRLPATVSPSPHELIEWYMMISGHREDIDIVGPQDVAKFVKSLMPGE